MIDMIPLILQMLAAVWNNLRAFQFRFSKASRHLLGVRRLGLINGSRFQKMLTKVNARILTITLSEIIITLFPLLQSALQSRLP